MIRNIITAVLVLGFIAVVVFLDVSGVENVLSLRSGIETQKQIFLENQEFVAKVDKLVRLYKDNKESVDKISYILPKERDLPNLIVQLEALVLEQGLLLQQLELSNAQEGTSGKAEEMRTTKTTSISYHTVDINLGFMGNYPAFKNFLKAVEENMRLIDIDSITFSPESEENPGIFKFSLKLKTYYE